MPTIDHFLCIQLSLPVFSSLKLKREHSLTSLSFSTQGVKQSEPLIITSSVLPLRSRSCQQPQQQQQFRQLQLQQSLEHEASSNRQTRKSAATFTSSSIQQGRCESVAFSPSSPPATVTAAHGHLCRRSLQQHQQQQQSYFGKSPISSAFSSNSLLSSITICSPTTPPSAVFHKIITGLNSVTMKSTTNASSNTSARSTSNNCTTGANVTNIKSPVMSMAVAAAAVASLATNEATDVPEATAPAAGVMKQEQNIINGQNGVDINNTNTGKSGIEISGGSTGHNHYHSLPSSPAAASASSSSSFARSDKQPNEQQPTSASAAAAIMENAGERDGREESCVEKNSSSCCSQSNSLARAAVGADPPAIDGTLSQCTTNQIQCNTSTSCDSRRYSHFHQYHQQDKQARQLQHHQPPKVQKRPLKLNFESSTVTLSLAGNMFTGQHCDREIDQFENYLSKDAVQNHASINALKEVDGEPLNQQQQLQQNVFTGSSFEQNRQQFKSLPLESVGMNDNDSLAIAGKMSYASLQQQQQQHPPCKVSVGSQRPSLSSQISRSSTGSTISSGKSTCTSVSGTASSRPSLYSSDSGIFGDSVDSSVALFDVPSSESSTPHCEFDASKLTQLQRVTLGDENLMVAACELSELHSVNDDSHNVSSNSMTNASNTVVNSANCSVKSHQMTLRPRNSNGLVSPSASVNTTLSSTNAMSSASMSSLGDDTHNFQCKSSMLNQIGMQEQQQTGNEVFTSNIESDSFHSSCQHGMSKTVKESTTVTLSSTITNDAVSVCKVDRCAADTFSSPIDSICLRSGELSSPSKMAKLRVAATSPVKSSGKVDSSAFAAAAAGAAVPSSPPAFNKTDDTLTAVSSSSSSQLQPKLNPWYGNNDNDNVVDMNSPYSSSLGSIATTIVDSSTHDIDPYSTSPAISKLSVSSCNGGNLLSYPPPKMITPRHRYIINKLRSDGYIRTEKIYQVMLHVNFANFGWSYSYR